ncbi:MAG: hypothetical protein AB8F74_19610 [Saprospiraceae bacterium]
MTTFKVPTSPAVLKVHSILDAKIKDIEYQTQCNFQDCFCGKNIAPGPASEDRAKSLTQNFELMLQQVEERTAELKQLQIIKCWLRKENLMQVAELLQNDTYLSHSEDALESMLKKGALELLRLRHNV